MRDLADSNLYYSILKSFICIYFLNLHSYEPGVTSTHTKTFTLQMYILCLYVTMSPERPFRIMILQLNLTHALFFIGG